MRARARSRGSEALAVEEARQSEALEGSEGGGGVAVGEGAEDLEGVPGFDEVPALEAEADGLHGVYARAYPEAPLREERLLRELLWVEASHGCDRGTNEWFFLPSKATPEAERIYRLVGLRLPRRATPVPPPRRLARSRLTPDTPRRTPPGCSVPTKPTP